MRRAVFALALLASPPAIAQMAPQTWDADQIGANNTCTDVGYFQANNLSGVGDRCVKTDATGKLIPASFDCVDPASLANTQFQDASLGLLPKEPVIGTGFTNGSICAVDDPGSTRTDIDLCPVSPVDSGAGTLLVSRVISNGVGQLSFASTIGLASDMTESGGNLTQADYPLVSRATNAPATAQNLGAIATAPLGCVTSGGVCTVDGLTLSGGLHFNTGTGAETLDSFTCSANQFVSSSSTSGLACTQPAFSDLSGSEACSQTPAFTGDVTKSAGSCTTVLANIPNDTPAVGDILFTAIAAPSTPAAGKGRLYEDSGSKNFALKNDAGTVNHGAQTVASSSHVALTGLADNGSWTTQTFQTPLTACTDYVSLSCVSGTTDLGGTNATPTVIGIENTGRMRGDLLATGIIAPGTPAGGIGALYFEAGSKNIAVKDDAGNVNHGIRDKTCGASTWISSVANTGVSTCTQPAFSDLTGSIACGQIPAAGTCTPTTRYGNTGSYLASVTIDAKGWTTSVTTTTTPLAKSLVYTMAGTGLSIGPDRSTLIMPLPAGAPISNTAAAGTAVSTTLAANWGSSTQSPPTFGGFTGVGSVDCNGDITFYSTTGTGAAILVSALWCNATPRATPGNWRLIASSTTGLAASAGSSVVGGVAFSASSGSGLLGSCDALVFVFYRSDASPSTLTSIDKLSANVVCGLGV